MNYILKAISILEGGISIREDVNPENGIKKYGEVTFADPTNNKYPIDTPKHILAAWRYINMPKNAAFYNDTDLAELKKAIKEALDKLKTKEVASIEAKYAVDIVTNIINSIGLKL